MRFHNSPAQLPLFDAQTPNDCNADVNCIDSSNSLKSLKRRLNMGRIQSALQPRLGALMSEPGTWNIITHLCQRRYPSKWQGVRDALWEVMGLMVAKGQVFIGIKTLVSPGITYWQLYRAFKDMEKRGLLDNERGRRVNGECSTWNWGLRPLADFLERALGLVRGRVPYMERALGLVQGMGTLYGEAKEVLGRMFDFAGGKPEQEFARDPSLPPPLGEWLSDGTWRFFDEAVTA